MPGSICTNFFDPSDNSFFKGRRFLSVLYLVHESDIISNMIILQIRAIVYDNLIISKLQFVHFTAYTLDRWGCNLREVYGDFQMRTLLSPERPANGDTDLLVASTSGSAAGCIRYHDRRPPRSRLWQQQAKRLCWANRHCSATAIDAASPVGRHSIGTLET